MLYRHELEQWRARLDVDIDVTVDHADADWRGNVGVVPKLIPRAAFDPHETVALICGPEVMMRFTVSALRDAGVAAERIYVSMERNMKCAIGLCGHCQFGPTFVCKDGPVMRFDRIAGIFASAGDLTVDDREPVELQRPRLAVWKFASCDGCQLSLLDCEDELLTLAGAVEIANFPEASSARRGWPLRSLAGRRIDHHRARCRSASRRCGAQSKHLVTIGACATAGGIQALRNFADVNDFVAAVYAIAALYQHAGDIDADLGPCPGRFRVAAAVRSTRRSSSR